MKYYINGVSHEVPDLTAEEKERISQLKEKENTLYWQTIPYSIAVDREIRKKYAQHQVEAIINNYLAEPNNEEYINEFLELQEYRKKCKNYVKEKKATFGAV